MKAYSFSGSGILFWIAALIWLCALPASCLPGPVAISPQRVFETLFLPSGSDSATRIIIIHIRLARGCIALLCGGALAVAGVALQATLRNPLADPFTLGISQGAACGASLAIAFAATFPVIGQAAVITASALAGALLALALALMLGSSRGLFERESVILAGIAVASFMGAIVALVKALNEESITSIVFWILGSLQGRGWSSMPVLLFSILPAFMIICLNWRKLDVLGLGDEQASQLGLNPGRARLWLLGCASFMTAGCVAVCGIIGFVGLVIPHMIRLLVGPANGPLLLNAFFCGGIFLLLADCVARSILSGGQELPVGVITALAGGPFFAFLVWKK